MKKDIRTLLSTLQNVLWAGAEWKEVPMSEVIIVRASCGVLPLPRSGDTFLLPLAMKNVLGLKLKIITGYPGTREVAMALENGEVHGRVGRARVRGRRMTPRACQAVA